MLDRVRDEKDAFGGDEGDEDGQNGATVWMNRPKQVIDFREAAE